MNMPPSSICGKCGADNPPHAQFCRSCGQSLQYAQPTLYDSSTGRLFANVLLKQRYRIIGQTGRGGMAAVYKAEDIQLGNRTVAVKEMSQKNLSEEEVKHAADAFKQEAIILAGLQHPNLPSIFDHFEENGRWYLVMSFIPGETLAEYLAKAQGGRLPLDEAIQIGIQLCSVLDYLHNQHPAIIFRDLKPTNIMRTPSGHIYLIDFGIARHFKPGQSRDTAYYGSMGYAPPEQYGNAQTTQRSDIYSLGATLYRLISGYDPASTPFRLPPLQSVLPGAPADLAALLAQMLDMDEDRRPANMLLVKQRLQNIASPIAPPPPSFAQFAQTVYVPGPNPPAPLPPTRQAAPLYLSGASSTPIPPAAPAPPPTSRSPRSKRTVPVIIAAVILLLAAGGGLAFAIINNVNTTNHNNAVATEQAQAQATSAAATATAAANDAATATAVAALTATAVANPNPYTSGGTFAFLDPLGQQSEWSEQTGTNGGQCQYSNNAFQVSQAQTSFVEICPSNDTFGNFVFEVQMTITQGDCGGITVRNNSDNTNLYLFEVCQDGSYQFIKYVSHSGNNTTTLAHGNASAINTGLDQSNTVAIVANGGDFQLFVNQQQIDSASDSDFSQGVIGLIADPMNNQTTVTYQNARLWML
jgi:serine/threonine protein kinase